MILIGDLLHEMTLSAWNDKWQLITLVNLAKQIQLAKFYSYKDLIAGRQRLINHYQIKHVISSNWYRYL